MLSCVDSARLRSIGAAYAGGGFDLRAGRRLPVAAGNRRTIGLVASRVSTPICVTVTHVREVAGSFSDLACGPRGAAQLEYQLVAHSVVAFGLTISAGFGGDLGVICLSRPYCILAV
jgi:hypothetical protein